MTLSEAGTLVNPFGKCHAVTWQVLEEVTLAYNKQQGMEILEDFSLSYYPVLTVLSVWGVRRVGMGVWGVSSN